MPTSYSLPNKIDPFRSADHAVNLHGTLLIKDMQRLCGSLSTDEGDVTVSLQFGVNDEGVRYLQGHLETNVMLQCQRCMGSFKYGIISDLLVGIVHTEEEAAELSATYDPVIAKEGMLILSDVIEDELIISLPIVPMHDLPACKVKLPLVASSGSAAEVEKSNPFNVIELLRTERNPKKE